MDSDDITSSWSEFGAEQPTEVNVLQKFLDDIQDITSKGLPYHQCELFHDQVHEITYLQKKGIRYSESDISRFEGFPQQCKDQAEKLGCAHVGWKEKQFGPGAIRPIDAPTRTTLIKALESLAKHAPDALRSEDAGEMKRKIEESGVRIAQLDVDMGHRPTNEYTKSEHSDIVQELFSMAQRIEKLLEQAIAEGKGVVSYQESIDELGDPNDPFSMYDV